VRQPLRCWVSPAPLWRSWAVHSFPGGCALYLCLALDGLRTAHSSLVLGTLFATEIVPVLLFGAFAGVYVDRLNRRHLLLGADLLRAMLVALIPLLSLLGLLYLWQLYALAFSLALLSLASDVATTAVLPVLAQSENTRANAAYQFVMQAAEFAGPAIATLGGFHTLWLDALSFGGTFLVIWRVPNFPGQIRGPLVRHVLSDLRVGLRWLWKEPVFKMLSLQAMLDNLGLGMVSAVFLYYLRAQLRLPAQLAGLEYAMVGVGGLLGKSPGCAAHTPVASWHALSSTAIVRTARTRFDGGVALVVGAGIEHGNSCRMRYGLDHPQHHRPPGTYPYTADGKGAEFFATPLNCSHAFGGHHRRTHSSVLRSAPGLRHGGADQRRRGADRSFLGDKPSLTPLQQAWARLEKILSGSGMWATHGTSVSRSSLLPGIDSLAAIGTKHALPH
jgi:hypothetical protein